MDTSCWKSMFIGITYILQRLWGEVKCFVFGGEPYATSETVNMLNGESGEWFTETFDQLKEFFSTSFASDFSSVLIK